MTGDENRLVRVQGPGGVDVRYTYDQMGRMLTRDDGEITQFIWDGFDCIRETTGMSTTTYCIPEGLLTSFIRDGARFEVHTDHVASVRMVTDENGDVVLRREFDAWGNELAGNFDNVPGGFHYGFVGAFGCRKDPTVGLVYMRARWYGPQLRRFISRDPIGQKGGYNLYGYVHQNPVKFVDPSGRFTIKGDKAKDLIRRIKDRTCIEILVDKKGAVTGVKITCGSNKCLDLQMRNDILWLLGNAPDLVINANGNNNSIDFGGFKGTNRHDFDMTDFDRTDATFANAMLNHEIHETVAHLQDVASGRRLAIANYNDKDEENNRSYTLAHRAANTSEGAVLNATRINEGHARDGSAVMQYQNADGSQFYYRGENSGGGTRFVRHDGFFSE